MTAPQVQPQRPVSGFAVAALVLGITGIVLPAAICGIVALVQIKGGSHSGTGMAIAGLLLSAAWLALLALFITSFVVAWPQNM
jgi:Domain of unknown function (DUF4190)